MKPFSLTKWYFDCVADDGRAVIGYWASLAWRGVALTWQNVTVYERGRPPACRSSVMSGLPPEVAGDTIAWRAPALACAWDVESRQQPLGARLLECEAGVVEWRAQAPVADVSVQLDGCEPVRGRGYAERIFIGIPPWRLPIRTLRWGRWIDAEANRSLVWIDWRGDSPRTWVFVDGTRVPAATVTDEDVCADGMKLALGNRRTLHSRTFAEIASAAPRLHAVVPKSILALRETKWCSEGSLLEGSAVARPGYAIHEVAVFR